MKRVFLRFDSTGKVEYINYRSDSVPESVEGMTIEVEVPEPERIDGKYAVMYYRNGSIKYEYEDIPVPPSGTEVPVVPEMPYNERVNALIRQRYSLSEELAVLRQRDTKPAEYSEYFAYAEACKAKAKEVEQS